MRAKLVLFVFLLACIPIKSKGQGTLQFMNFGANVNAPVTNAAGNRIIGPSPYVADLYWSSDTNSPVGSLTAAGFNRSFTTLTLSGGGYFLGGVQTLPVLGPVLAQVRVWDMTYGATYAQARDNGGEFGTSNPVLVFLDLPPGPGTQLVGLQGFQLGWIPEPSASLLVVAGGTVWCWLRKRSRIYKLG